MPHSTAPSTPGKPTRKPAPPNNRQGAISDFETLTKAELAARLAISIKTLNRLLRQLDLAPAFEGTGHALVSGRVFNRAIEAEQLRCNATN